MNNPGHLIANVPESGGAVQSQFGIRNVEVLDGRRVVRINLVEWQALTGSRSLNGLDWLAANPELVASLATPGSAAT